MREGSLQAPIDRYYDLLEKPFVPERDMDGVFYALSDQRDRQRSARDHILGCVTDFTRAVELCLEIPRDEWFGEIDGIRKAGVLPTFRWRELLSMHAAMTSSDRLVPPHASDLTMVNLARQIATGRWTPRRTLCELVGIWSGVDSLALTSRDVTGKDDIRGYVAESGRPIYEPDNDALVPRFGQRFPRAKADLRTPRIAEPVRRHDAMAGRVNDQYRRGTLGVDELRQLSREMINTLALHAA